MSKHVIIREIEATFSALKTVLSKFSNEELNTVPFEGSWTAGQVAGHIIKSIGGIPDEETEPVDRHFDEKTSAIREMFLDMKMKFKTDPYLEPEKSHYQLKEILDTLNELEKQHVTSAREKDLTALCLDMELPTFGLLTRYEWIRFIMVHTQRHTRQIENIYKTLKS